MKASLWGYSTLIDWGENRQRTGYGQHRGEGYAPEGTWL